MNLPPILRLLLWPLSVVYGGIALLRARLYARGWLKQKRLRGTVISVGNLTVGGTGKTPMVLWLAERFHAEGKRVAVLSRGYRGAHGTSDEIEFLRDRLGKRAPVGIGQDRYEQGCALEAQGCDVFLLDDGLQHLQLARDVDIVMVDGSRPLEGEWILPAGRLREPLAALQRTDIITISRATATASMERTIRKYSPAPIFYASTKLLGFRRCSSGHTLSPLQEKITGSVFAFCGIGNPTAFFTDLERWGVSLAGRAAFRDHHSYTARDFRRLEDAAARAGTEALVTTEKDAQNLGDMRFVGKPLYICEIELEISNEPEFWAALQSAIGPCPEVPS